MFTQSKNYSTDVINTDRHGYRFTKRGSSVATVDRIDAYESVNLCIGGSSAFGVGATSDGTTIPSRLSDTDGKIWLNLGIRAGNSMQECISLLNIIGRTRIEKIVVFSGFNDIYLSMINECDAYYDFLFQNKRILSALEQSSMTFIKSRKRWFSKIVAKWKGISQQEIAHQSYRKMLKYRPVSSNDGKTADVFEKFGRTCKRYFIFLASLKSLFDIDVVYCLQPYFGWTKKPASPEEKILFSYLEDKQKNSVWNTIKNKIDRTTYFKILQLVEQFSQEYRVPLLDANLIFSTDEFMFVDGLHLTDDGYRVCADHINNSLKQIEKSGGN